MNCLFDMKLRSVVILVTDRGERDRFVIRFTGERGCTPLDSEEVSRNVREHQEGLVNTVGSDQPSRIGEVRNHRGSNRCVHFVDCPG